MPSAARVRVDESCACATLMLLAEHSTGLGLSSGYRTVRIHVSRTCMGYPVLKRTGTCATLMQLDKHSTGIGSSVYTTAQIIMFLGPVCDFQGTD